MTFHTKHFTHAARHFPRARLATMLVACGVMTAMLFGPGGAAARAQGAISVLLNGRAIDFGGVPPTQVTGRVLVPLRGVFEALGATVDYDDATGTVSAARGSTQIQLRLGSAQATVNGQMTTLDVPAQARLGRTFVPLRFVSEALGAQVSWDEAQRTVTLTAPDDRGAPDTGGPFGAFPNADTPPRPANPPATRNPSRNNAPPYVPPSNVPPVSGAQVSGTVVKVDATMPATVTIRGIARGATGDGTIGSAAVPRSYTLDPNAQIFRRTTGVVTPGAVPTFGPAVELSDVSRLLPGEEVRLTLDEDDQVTQVNALVSLVTARVRQAQGGQIVLEDNRGTALTLGANLRFIDTRGRASVSANLPPGQIVALFIAPSTRRIYQVSASRADIAAATPSTYTAPGTAPDNGDTFPDNNQFPDNRQIPGNGQPPFGTAPAGAPQINSVQHNATRALRASGTLTVTVRGTPGAQGSFSVLPTGAELPLAEDPDRPGVYTGTYTVRAGENLLNGRVTAFLRNAAGQESLLQSQRALTIDTVAPRITTTSPLNNATINTTQPNIVISANDIGGSGLSRASVTLNNQRLSDEQITVSPNGISFIPPAPLDGPTTIRATVFDAAGNSAATILSFFVDENADTGAITTLTHNATRALQAGERLVVQMTATPGGRAFFDVLGNNQRLVARNVPMTEIAAGRYRGSYTVQDATLEGGAEDARLFIRGRFTDVNGVTATTDATAPVDLLGGAPDVLANNEVSITAPAANDRIASPLTVRGTASPNATVEVSVRAEGTRYLVFEHKQELGTQQVQAGPNGVWMTAPITLPRVPRGVAGLRYVITVSQIDAANRRSEPITLAVEARETR